MSFRKPCHMPFRKLIPPFTLTAVGRGWELEGQLTYREYRREGPYFVLSFRLLLFWVLCGVNKSNCLKPVVGKRWSEWKSEFQIEFNIKLNWFKRSVVHTWICLTEKNSSISRVYIFDGLYHRQGGGERANSKMRNRLILQTVPVCNPYAQINLLSGKGKTDRKSRTATAQWEFPSPKLQPQK